MIPIAALMGLAIVVPTTPAAKAARSAPVSTVNVTVDAASSGRPINEGLIGTNQTVPGGIGPMRQIGVDWARTDMYLNSSYHCTTGTWDPTTLDQLVSEDRAEGAQPELLVDYSPSCLTTDPLHNGYNPPDLDHYGPWSTLIEEVAYHEITANHVRIFEVWNEPDGTFWYGTVSDYLNMYRATALAIEAAAAKAGVPSSQLLVGGPALLFSDPTWLEPFLAFVSENHLPLGFVSWHYYGDYPGAGPIYQSPEGYLPPYVKGTPPYWYNPGTRAQTYGYEVEQVKDELTAFPDLHPLTVIDEWNLDAGYDPRMDGPYDAAFAAAVLDSVQAAGLDRMAFFRVADDAKGTFGNWGILFYDMAPKPVYWTFAFWHALAGRSLSVDESPDQAASDPIGRIGAVASKAPGHLRVLLYDYAPYDPLGSYGATDPNTYDHEVNLSFDGLGPGAWRYQIRLVDAADNAKVITTGRVGPGHDMIEIPMAGESVALVELSRT